VLGAGLTNLLSYETDDTSSGLDINFQNDQCDVKIDESNLL
jgi:hypothetical protein